MLNTYQETEDPLADVVVCNKSSIEEMVRELETRRAADCWTALETGVTPDSQQNGISAEVLIHVIDENGGETVTAARYLPNSRQWRVQDRDLDCGAKVIGWKPLPKPEYGS